MLTREEVHRYTAMKGNKTLMGAYMQSLYWKYSFEMNFLFYFLLAILDELTFCKVVTKDLNGCSTKDKKKKKKTDKSRAERLKIKHIIVSLWQDSRGVPRVIAHSNIWRNWTGNKGWRLVTAGFGEAIWRNWVDNTERVSHFTHGKHMIRSVSYIYKCWFCLFKYI
jgi:hypothetical protein